MWSLCLLQVFSCLIRRVTAAALVFVFQQIVCAALSVACATLECGICPLRSRVPFAFSPFWPRCLLRVSTFLVSFSKVCIKMDVKSERSLHVSCQDLPQASCLIRVEGHSALACAELEERQESLNIDFPSDDVRDAVVAESPEMMCRRRKCHCFTGNLDWG